MAVNKLTALAQGNPLNSNGADVAQSVNQLIDGDQLIDDLSQAYIFDTVALMKLSTIAFPDGKKIFWQGYHVESDGGSNWGIVKSGAHTDDGGSVFTLADGKYIRANITGTVLVNKFGTLGDGSDTAGETSKIQKAYNYAIANQVSASVKAGVVKFKGGMEYAINGVVIDSEVAPIITKAYGAWFKVTGATGTGFLISNLRSKFFGGTFRQSDVGNNNTAILVRQSAGADNTSFNTYRDVDIINMWRGLDFIMSTITFPGAATFRHRVDCCHIRNTTNGTKTWVGSRGINFGGNVIGNSSGNDSKVTNTVVAGYEVNIYSNGVRTSVNNCSVDGGGVGVNFAGSSCTIKDHYSEYNDTGVNIEATSNNTDIEASLADTTPIIDAGKWTQYQPLEPAFNLQRQTIFTPTGNQPAATFNEGTDTLVPIIECLGAGEMKVRTNGAVQATVNSVGASTYSASIHELRSSSSIPESSQPILYIAGETGNITQFRSVSGANGSFTGATMIIPQNATTSRSINAGGTVNVSGADYAEYMKKSGVFDIAKGAICGIDSSGLLTDVFADSLSFVVKSTDPSYVGGDTWGSDEELGMSHPVMPALETKDTTNKYNNDMVIYNEALEVYNEALEVARQTVDRIAYCGRVPVNVLGTNPGDYIIPTNNNGKIKGVAKKTITFEESLIKVGKVVSIGKDGRAVILVSVG